MSQYDLVVVGTSLGGLTALQQIFRSLRSHFPLPIVVVQHRHRSSSDSLPQFLERQASIPVKDAEDKEYIRPGRIYLAPPDYHLLIERGGFSLTLEGPVNYSRPSIDLLFESAADSYGEKVIGILLTGANQDGAEGIKRIRSRGGYTIVQDPSTAEAPEMPQSALNITEVDQILPIKKVAATLNLLTTLGSVSSKAPA